MCGIAGILRVHPPGLPVPPHGVAIPEAWLDVLDASIKHRGPDGQGRFRDRAVRADGTVVDVALVHRRLSILDHAGGAQPMVGERDSRTATRDSGGAAVGESRDDGGALFQGLALPVLFHGKPSDAVRYREVGGGERHSLALRALKDGSDLVAVVFNGCIYNHRELRKELQAAGHKFVSDHSDTEVLVHGWREWGRNLPGRLDGMFAFVLWDRSMGSMLLARDSFGEKPLEMYHVARDGSWINAFGSVTPASTSLRQLLGESEVSVEPRSRVQDWLRFGWAQNPPSSGAASIAPGKVILYRGIDERLPLGMNSGEMAVRLAPESWHFGVLSKNGVLSHPARSFDRSVKEFDALLDEAVASRLEADVPLGCFLSGGVDSSLIAMYASRVRRDVTAFTVRMNETDFDESEYAAKVARCFGISHEILQCDASPANDLVDVIRTLGLPFGDSSLLPTHWLSKATRRHATVALSGDGGDELFVGYERYRISKWLGSGLPFMGKFGQILGMKTDAKSRRAKLARAADAAGNLGYWDLISIFPHSLLQNLIGKESLEKDAAWFRKSIPQECAETIAVDLYNYLPDDLLRKTDTASMHAALEVRCPLLAPSVVSAAMSATIDSLLQGHQRKGLLRALARNYLPAEIVDRPKMGFAIPIGEWFRTDYGGMKTLLMDTLNSADPFPASKLGLELNRSFIAKMVDEHMSGRRDHSQRLYMLLVLGIWVRTL